MTEEPAAQLDALLSPLLDRVTRFVQEQPRTVVGLTGPPGVGKSTLTDGLLAGLRAAGARAVVVGMDGFHLDQRELERLGRADRKGAPDTFDPYGYVALLRRLRLAEEPVTYAPRFDRDLEQSIGSAVAVPAEIDVVVTEGNYLLMDGRDPDGRPWAAVRGLLDVVAYIDLPDDVRLERLVARHVRHGRSESAAREWVMRSDEANARLVARTRDRADLVLDLGVLRGASEA